MSATGDRQTGDGAPRSAAARDVLLVTLAILALVVAAFAVPPLGPSSAQPGSGPEEEPTPDGTDEGGDSGEPGSGDGRGIDGVRIVLSNGTGDGGADEPGRALNATAGDPHPGCFVVVWDRLLPGANATVLLWNEGAYVADRRVRFDGRSIGHTDDRGRADGRVPYVRELEVEASVPPVETCRFLHLRQNTSLAEWERTHGGSPVILVSDDAGVPVERRNGTVSHTLPVEGEARLRVEGDPYPGETIRLNATVDGVPMRSATVRMNGETVGETDGRGYADLTVPDDGTERLALAATRGEITARATVEVLLLSVALRPTTPLAIPGGPGTVVATVGDRPAGDVTVSLDDEGTIATTNDRGLASIRLPSDPFATVTARGHGQTATAAVWPVYLPTVLGLLLAVGLVAGSFVRASRGESAFGPTTVAVFWGVLAVLVVAWFLAGPWGVGALALAALAVVALVYHTRLLAWAARAAVSIVATIRAVHGFAIRFADRLGRIADRLRGALQRLVRRIRDLPRSATALLALVWGWLLRLPVRALGELRRFLGTIGRGGRDLLSALLAPKRLAFLGLAAILTAAAYHEAEAPGAAVVAAVLLVLLLVYRWRQSREDATDPGESGSSSTRGGAGDAAGTDDATWRPALRTLWRTFARWIVPGRWQTRTAGEVARAAVDRGFPREPVERLTETFREVEYGDRALSEDRYRRARTAFDDIEEARTEREGTDR